MTRSLYERSPVALEKKRALRRVLKYEPRVLSRLSGSNKESSKSIRPQINAVDWKDEKVWEKIRNEGCYHKSNEIIISCGTVTINNAQGPCPEVLVVYNNDIGIYQLPKGRKDIGEGYLDAAIRETTEETGIAVRPLRLRFGSRATPPRLATTTGAALCGPEDPSTRVTKSISNETIGVSECTYQAHPNYPDPATGAWRNIHWYAAEPRYGIERDESCMPLPEDREKFSTFWFTEVEALSRLKLDDEKFSKSPSKMDLDTQITNSKLALVEAPDVGAQLVRVAFEYTRNMSADDWLSNKRLDSEELS
ncbi:hypothetical protein GGS21DRAFT_488109 [Xylaria nigripes]|nr:hypothetical protein GGS21DRAFT_488109 [Xylaria nigripes]